MKVGDLVQYNPPHQNQQGVVGTVVDFPLAIHAKEFQKVRVLTVNGIADWIMQFCNVINES